MPGTPAGWPHVSPAQAPRVRAGERETVLGRCSHPAGNPPGATSVADLDEITELVANHDLAPVYVMPEGRTAEEVTRRLAEIADPAIERGFHLTTRLHLLTWGDQRGR
jgi:hypothetical protein